MTSETRVAILGVPIDLGAGRRGVDMGPSAIRYAGLSRRLHDLGHQVVDFGNLTTPMVETTPLPPPESRLRYLEPIAEVCQRLAELVSDIAAQAMLPLILGGDHSLAIGSASGSARGRRLGLIWIDAHADFNDETTTPSGNIHGCRWLCSPDAVTPLDRAGREDAGVRSGASGVDRSARSRSA